MEVCEDSECFDSWSPDGKAWQKLHCSAASGVVGPGLPPLFDGNFDLCNTFRGAHFCTMETGVLYVGLPNGSAPFALGPAFLGQCISDACGSSTLKEYLVGNSTEAMNRLLKMAAKMLPQDLQENHAGVAESVASQMRQSAVVRCADESFSGSSLAEGLDFGGWLWVATLFLLLTLSFLATCVPSSRFRSKFKFFYVYKNYEKLMTDIPGDFSCLNGIRVFSMFWIICGHTNLTLQDPVNYTNPTGLDSFIQKWHFVFFRAGEFSVDTFFCLSAFLATMGTLRQLSFKPLTPRSYFSTVTSRWWRLAPSYSFALLFWWKVMPFLGSGPFWNHMMEGSTQAGTPGLCDDHWWTNLLFINNVVPWDKTAMCFGWSWYLANDMQFFLLVPLLCTLYLKGNKKTSIASRLLWQWLPVSFLLVFQIASTVFTIYHYELTTSSFQPDPSYQSMVYYKPWCRIGSYCIGIMFAFLHDAFPEWKSILQREFKLARAAVFLAIALIFTIIFGYYGQYKCEPVTGDQHDCTIFFAGFRYGFFVQPNWFVFFFFFFFSFSHINVELLKS